MPSLDTRRWLYFQQYFYPHRHEYELCSLVWLNLKVIHDSLNCNHREIPFDVRTQSLRFTDFIWDVYPLKGAVKLVVLKDKRRWFTAPVVSDQFRVRNSTFFKLCPSVWLNLKEIHYSFNHREILFDVKTQSLRFTDFILDVYPSNFQIALSITSLIQNAYDFVIPRYCGFNCSP